MLVSARPIFTNVPASYADPVGLADQQAPGVVSLIVVRYEPADGQPHDALGPTYDSYVSVSGQLLAVARTTADYRYPVTPAVGLARFIEHRDAGHPAFLSVYEMQEDDCARFVETVFYSECLKLHVDGADSAPLVAQQIVRSGCGDGILEVNDFSQPGEPRIRLVDLDALADSIGTVPEGADPGIEAGTVDPTGLTAVLAGHLDGVDGRVLLYDRAKNKAAVAHRAGKPWDLDAAVQEANRLADARRAVDPTQATRQATVMASHLRAAAPDDQVEAVETYLRDAAENPRTVAPTHPHHTGLAALVAEMQGAATFGGLGATASPQVLPVPVAVEELGDGRAGPAPATPGPGEAAPPLLPHQTAPLIEAAAVSPDTPHAVPEAGTLASTPMPSPPASGTPSAPSAPTQAAPRSPASAPSIASGSTRHVLATELDVLRASVYALFEDAVSREKAVGHEQHVLEEHDIASPVAPHDTLRYLRALLCDNPPSRWHGFKRSRAKIVQDVCTKLLAFHTANAHVDDAVIHDVGQLWARLCK